MPTQGVPWQMPQGEGRSDLPVVMRPLQWHPAAVAGPAAALRLSPSAPRRARIARTPQRAILLSEARGGGRNGILFGVRSDAGIGHATTELVMTIDGYARLTVGAAGVSLDTTTKRMVDCM